MSQEYKKLEQEFSKRFPSIYSEAKTDKDRKILISLYNLAKFSFEKVNPNIIKTAFDKTKFYEPENLNDFYFILFLAAKENQEIKKVAYPQFPLIVSDDYGKEYDLDKWGKLVYKIYDAVLSNDMTLTEAIDYYASSLGKKSDEDLKFKKWIKYYLRGDNKKYANKEEAMKKRADYQFGLNNSFYYPENISMPDREENPLPVKTMINKQIDSVNNKNQVLEWKKQLGSAIRRIDKLLRAGDIAPDVASKLFEQLHNFNMAVYNVKTEVTASDITFKTANNFKKLGFNSGHDILIKTAQEIEQAPAPATAPAAEAAPATAPAAEAPPAAEVPAPAEPEKAVGEGPVSEDPVARVFENLSGAREGEYEKLSTEIDLGDAITKLEEIAARLSDRRVIRLLAEFDIMLDKIGIAAMFPELAEAQSKLIDGYSYALVRITKMLGMLSSGKSLQEISDAKKTKLTENVRKEVDKTLAPDETAKEPTPKEEAIKEEFQEKPEAEQKPSPAKE